MMSGQPAALDDAPTVMGFARNSEATALGGLVGSNVESGAADPGWPTIPSCVPVPASGVPRSDPVPPPMRPRGRRRSSRAPRCARASLPLAHREAVAVAAGDQLLGAELLDELGVDLGQVDEPGRKPWSRRPRQHPRSCAGCCRTPAWRCPATVNTLMPRRSFLPPCETSTAVGVPIRARRHTPDRHHARIAAGPHEGV